MFDKVMEDGGIFHLWGHSWEVDGHGDWEKLEDVLRYISRKKGVRYVVNGELPNVVKPKLMIATPYFPPKTGGVERYTAEMAKGAMSAGYDVTIVTSALESRKTSITEENGARVYRLKPTLRLLQTPIGLGWYWQIRRIIRQERPDIINTHAPVPFMADITTLAAGRVPVVATYHAGAMRKGRLLTDSLLWFYETCILSLSLNKARVIICGSEFVRDTFLARYRHKSITITPGVDTDYFAKPKHPPSDKRVLFVGNAVSGNKGLDVLERAVAGMSDVMLHVVGEVAEKSNQQNVVYHGVLRGKPLVRQYQNASIFVLPSTGKTESFGMVLVEAMACGVPVIGTNVGGIPLVIDDNKTGLIVSPSDSTALTHAIRGLLDNPEKSAKLSSRASQKVQASYTWPRLVGQYVAVLRKAKE